MKFYPLREVCDDPSLLEEDYRSAREIGVIRTGKEFLFFRVRLRQYYMPYAGITRCFRRVLLVPASMCCGRGDLQIENLVVCSGKEELAVIQLPGTRAARELMKELKSRMPDADFSLPEKSKEQ